MDWQKDEFGTELVGPKDAFRALKQRAQKAIDEGDDHGIDVRQFLIRVRDEHGEVLFEGTTAEAASLVIDGRVYLPKEA